MSMEKILKLNESMNWNKNREQQYDRIQSATDKVDVEKSHTQYNGMTVALRVDKSEFHLIDAMIASISKFGLTYNKSGGLTNSKRHQWFKMYKKFNGEKAYKAAVKKLEAGIKRELKKLSATKTQMSVQPIKETIYEESSKNKLSKADITAAVEMLYKSVDLNAPDDFAIEMIIISMDELMGMQVDKKQAKDILKAFDKKHTSVEND